MEPTKGQVQLPVVSIIQPATTGETMAAGLSYNLRVGTTPGGAEVLAPQADLATGTRRQPALGNVQTQTLRAFRAKEMDAILKKAG